MSDSSPSRREPFDPFALADDDPQEMLLSDYEESVARHQLRTTQPTPEVTMRYMNDYDIEQARRRFGRGETPNRLALVMVVDNLREWANTHSDGWAYWPPPCRAASKAMALIESTAYPEFERRQHEDITEAEMLAAVRPIKSFLTKHRHLVSAEDREIILRAVTS